ncbi:MAG: type II toxin-antitoxin system VapC family toxin [Chloroflexota bacterium]|nr:type II toxin-antitoxin system VapC family toxin [Chloroflexota bacterium]
MICLDASVAVKLLLDEERSDQARGLFRGVRRAGEAIVGPPLLPLEVTNILRQGIRPTGGISLAEAIVHLDDFLALPIEIHDPPRLHHQALALAAAHGLPATYDAHYLALAQHFGCDLWTDDLRLLRQVGDSLPFVRSLGEFSA